MFIKLKELSLINGSGSQIKKFMLIKDILDSCDANESKFFLRALTGNIRNGIGEQTILESLAHAFVINVNEKKEAAKRVKDAFNKNPNFEELISNIIEEGVFNIEGIITPHTPLNLMLSHPIKDINEVFKRIKCNFISEYKYDGERAQIHICDGIVSIFSRNLINHSNKYPDLISLFQKNFLNVKSAILDVEIVAFDIEKKKIKSFQELSRRKRKNVMEVSVQVCVYAFDLLFFNGLSLLKRCLLYRKNLLYENFPEIASRFQHVTSMCSNICTDSRSISIFLDQSIKDGCEGLVIKRLDSQYEMAKRSHNWLKIKNDYLLADTLDLVVIGGYYGKGKRKGVYGSYLLAVYDRVQNEYQSICKLGTGLKDQDLKEQFKSLIIIDKPNNYNVKLVADVWFDPNNIFEVKCANFSISPVHTAAQNYIGKGISLRFPRFVRVRNDKIDITTSEQVVDLFNQTIKM